MTVYKAYLVALRATVTLTFIPVMTPGLYDRFPGSPGTFPGHIRWFPGPFFDENIDIGTMTMVWGVKYQYFHQKKSRTWTKMHRKRVRRSSKSVLGSRKVD